MPLDGREQVEIALTIALTLFAVAALALLKPERIDHIALAVVSLVLTLVAIIATVIHAMPYLPR